MRSEVGRRRPGKPHSSRASASRVALFSILWEGAWRGGDAAWEGAVPPAPSRTAWQPSLPVSVILRFFQDSAYKEQLNGGFIGKSLTGICLRKTGASLDG